MSATSVMGAVDTSKYEIIPIGITKDGRWYLYDGPVEKIVTGEWEDYPNFVDCTMFGNRARSLHQYLSKGTKVAIEGKLRWSQWERDGQKRSKLEVIVDELEFMSSRNGGGAQSYGGDFGGNQGYAPATPAYSAPAPMPAPAPAPAPMPAAPVIDASSSVYDDDIPF